MNRLARSLKQLVAHTILSDATRSQLLELERVDLRGLMMLSRDVAEELWRAGEFEPVLNITADALAQIDHLPATDPLVAHTCYLRACALRDSGDKLGALELFTTARVRYRIAKDATSEAKAGAAAAAIYVLLRQWELAEHALAAIKRQSELLKLDSLKESITVNQAIMHARQGYWHLCATAMRHLRTPDERRSINSRLLLAWSYRHLGVASVGMRLGRHVASAARTSRLPRLEALAYEYSGDCLLDLGDTAGALKRFEKCLKLALEIAPDGDVTCEAYRRLAEVHLVLGNLDAAAKSLAEGLRLADHLHDDYERVGLLRVQAGLALEAGDLVDADRIFHKAAMLALAKGFRFEHALTLETQGFAHTSTARPDTADRFLDEARAIYEELGLTRLALRLKRGARALSRPRPKKTPTPLAERAREWERFGIFTRSHRLLATLDDLRAIADKPLSVLLIGESGVGKELIVRALHALSGRRGRLVAMNCAAIQETMLESELFGSRRGAFTGAENRDGLVAEADQGTLFLDEIGDMPKALQTKLLRFLEDSSYRPVGGRRDHTVAVRFVSATNADLERRVAKGTFREDLYYRIAGHVIAIPPLRRRPEDIELLANHFLRHALGDSEGTLPAFDESVLKAFRAYAWSGNVRELKNAVESAAFRVGTRKVITASMLPEKILSETGFDLERSRDVQRLTEAIVESDGSISAAAKVLGVSRQTLYRRAEQLGVDLDAIRGR